MLFNRRNKKSRVMLLMLGAGVAVTQAARITATASSPIKDGLVEKSLAQAGVDNGFSGNWNLGDCVKR
jgi:hypothetical protein